MQCQENKAGFLKRKNIEISVRRYLIDAMSFMAMGLFASLLMGTILKTTGQQLGLEFIVEFGKIAISVTGPAIAVGVAYGLQAPALVMFASVAVGAAADAAGGGPAGCYVSALLAVELGKLVSKETKLDILVTPMVTIVSGVFLAGVVGPGIGSFMIWLGQVLMWLTEMQPVPMGMLIAVFMGVILVMPISSAAIAVMLDLSGLAAGAATVGCCCQMVGFAACSYRENGIGGVFAQGIGMAMFQIPNIIRNPLVFVPTTAASAILGPLATTILPMQNSPIGAGMGTSGLVGQIGTLTVMGGGADVWCKIALLHFILPAALCFLISEYMRKKQWIKFGDLKLDI